MAMAATLDNMQKSTLTCWQQRTDDRYAYDLSVVPRIFLVSEDFTYGLYDLSTASNKSND